MYVNWYYIDNLRKSNKIEVNQIVKSLNINKSTWSRWKNRQREISAVDLKRVCDFLEININDVFISK